jgi:isocitrate dehydrogenase (NAD+)
MTPSNLDTIRITELLGDGISPELSNSVHDVADALDLKLKFEPVDLSLNARRKGAEACYAAALEAMRRTKVALKYPTATVEESPNKVLRERCGFSVIHRPCSTIPGVPTNFTKTVDVDIVRVATGGTYDDAGRRIGLESSVSVRVIERTPCLLAARFAFLLAAQRGRSVISASKYTIQRATDGLFEEAVDEAAKAFPKVKHKRILFDALLARLIMDPDSVQVVVTPNEYGDFLSDCAAGLIGSLGLADSANYAFNPDGSIAMAMFDPAGGTAPDIAGQDKANPTAALMAFSTLLAHVGRPIAALKLKSSVMGCLSRGETTGDLGGPLGTKAFTKAVIAGLS